MKIHRVELFIDDAWVLVAWPVNEEYALIHAQVLAQSRHAPARVKFDGKIIWATDEAKGERCEA